MPVRLSLPALSPQASPCDLLLPELREVIAGKLAPQDLIALSQVSHDWQEAAAPHWQAAYGPGPCHVPATAPAHWRAAMKQKLHIQHRLLAPCDGQADPAALLGVARRMATGGAPLPALLAFDLVGEAGRNDRCAMGLWIGRLRRQGRAQELRDYAASALKAHPDLAAQVMNAAVELGDLALCKLADDAGGDLRKAFNFCPVEAAKSGDLATFVYLLRHPRRTGSAQWEQALEVALQAGRMDMLQALATCGRDFELPLNLSRLLPQLVNMGAMGLAMDLLRSSRAYQQGLDLTRIPEEATRSAFLRALRDAGVDPAATLWATAASRAPQAVAACQQLGAVMYTPEAWQQALDAGCDEALARPYAADLRQLCTFRALGGCGHDFEAVGHRLLHSWHNRSGPLKWATVLIAAGASPQLRLEGQTLASRLGGMLLQSRIIDLSDCLTALAQSGCRLDPACFVEASEALELIHFDPQVLRGLLAMGYPARTRGLLLMCADANRLESVQALVERGAHPSEFDDRFRTAIDYATQPELVDYLRAQGLEPVPLPAGSPRQRPLLQDAAWRTARVIM